MKRIRFAADRYADNAVGVPVKVREEVPEPVAVTPSVVTLPAELATVAVPVTPITSVINGLPAPAIETALAPSAISLAFCCKVYEDGTERTS